MGAGLARPVKQKRYQINSRFIKCNSEMNKMIVKKGGRSREGEEKLLHYLIDKKRDT